MGKGGEQSGRRAELCQSRNQVSLSQFLTIIPVKLGERIPGALCTASERPEEERMSSFPCPASLEGWLCVALAKPSSLHSLAPGTMSVECRSGCLLKPSLPHLGPWAAVYGERLPEAPVLALGGLGRPVEVEATGGQSWVPSLPPPGPISELGTCKALPFIGWVTVRNGLLVSLFLGVPFGSPQTLLHPRR